MQLLSGLVLCCVLVGVVAFPPPPFQSCDTPGEVLTTVCHTGLCGPFGWCLPAQNGGHCAEDFECTSFNCNKEFGRCEKTHIFGFCLANEDCFSNNCVGEFFFRRCAPNPVGGVCVRHEDCTSGVCDDFDFKCVPTGFEGRCWQNSDCLSGTCTPSGKEFQPGSCTQSTPGQPCYNAGDCGGVGTSCLRPFRPHSVGVCYLNVGSTCATDPQCGSQFCGQTVGNVNPTCQPSGPRGPCASDADCNKDSNLYCHHHADDDHLGVCRFDPCAESPCSVNAVCHVFGDDFVCVCGNGYEGPGLLGANAVDSGCVQPVGVQARPYQATPNPQNTPTPVVGNTPISSALPATGACFSNFECGTLNCENNVCTVTNDACWTTSDCNVGYFCSVHVAPFPSVGDAHYPEHGHCVMNLCETDNGGCDDGVFCEPVSNTEVKCICPFGSFGSGITRLDRPGCVDPCGRGTDNGGCGFHGRCIPIDRDHTQCECFPGHYFTKKHGCHNPCDFNNGGCNVFEICTARGPEQSEVSCRCDRPGFLWEHDHCIVDWCFEACHHGEGCRRLDHGHECFCLDPLQSIDTAGFCQPNHCKTEVQGNTPECSPLAFCQFQPDGGQSNAASDPYISCTCPWGFSGTGFLTGANSGCTSTICPALMASDVSSILHAVTGNCGAAGLHTGDYCVLGCEPGFTPDVDPRGQCVGNSGGGSPSSSISFRPFQCKPNKREHHDRDGQVNVDHLATNEAWLCDNTNCKPKAPFVGWKNHEAGRLGLHWAPLGPSVQSLAIQVVTRHAGTQTFGPIANPGFATSAELNGFVVGNSYEVTLYATTFDGATYQGLPLFVTF